MTSRPLLLAASILLAFCAPSRGQSGPAEERSAPSVVSTAWVADRLTDPKTVVIHVGDRTEYDAEHLPGARFLSLDGISTPRGQGLTLELPAAEHLEDAFERLGVQDGGVVVVYVGKDWISPAARVVMTLDALGYGDRTFFMDGGLPAWKAEGRPVSAAPAEMIRGSFTPKPRADVIVTGAWVAARLGRADTLLVDARLEDFYSGQNDGRGRIPRPGHIKGAVNIPFTSLVDDAGRLKPRDVLAKQFTDAGASPGQTVVTYCHIGQQASFVYLVARHLGYDARLYDGSFEEWAANPGWPVEGPAR